MRPSDFRSDTVTRPTPAMLQAVLAAELGDDVLDGDPTVGRLERAAADWLGKEGALFVPSGTMANQVAVGAWTRPGDELLAARCAHVVTWEAGAVGHLHGVQSQTFDCEDGRLDPGAITRAVRPASIHCARTALLCLEQTFMGSGAGPGGRVVPLESLEAAANAARDAGLAVHLDGARLANAQVASGVPAARFAASADSVSVCLSKGLGAPVGSVVAGSAEFLERARVLRKRLGGWMRQAGLLAAAGLHALENHVERLADDHALARRLARELDLLPGLACPPDEVETNLVMVRVAPPAPPADELSRRLGERGVRVLPMGPALRFVTHLDVGDADVDRLVAALRELLPA